MDVSELREKPAGRQPIDTRALLLRRRSGVKSPGPDDIISWKSV
jgi:RecG-like helicase